MEIETGSIDDDELGPLVARGRHADVADARALLAEAADHRLSDANVRDHEPAKIEALVAAEG